MITPISNLDETTIAQLKTNLEELVEYKQRGHAVKNWTKNNSSNTKLNQIQLMTTCLAKFKTPTQILFLNSSFTLNYDYGNSDSGILEKDSTISGIADFMRSRNIWMDTIVLETSHMHDLVKLIEPLGGKIKHI
jgi:hypothetical protein